MFISEPHIVHSDKLEGEQNSIESDHHTTLSGSDCEVFAWRGEYVGKCICTLFMYKCTNIQRIVMWKVENDCLLAFFPEGILMRHE